MHFLSVHSYLPLCGCEYAEYKHEKKKGRDLQQRVDKTTIKKLPGSKSAISAIFTKPVERVMRMGFPKEQSDTKESRQDAECALSDRPGYISIKDFINKQTNYK